MEFIKKVLVVVALVAFLAGVVYTVEYGQNNFPTANYDEYIEIVENSNSSLMESNITNKKEFKEQANLVAYAVQRCETFKVSFICQTEEEEIVPLQSINFSVDLINNKEYREIYKANLITKTIELVKDKPSVKIVGTIMEWQTVKAKPFSSSNREYHRYALCDLDGNGSWDYITGGDETLLGVGFTTSPDESLFKEVNEANKVAFTSSEEIIRLENLDGSETIWEFEKLLNK